MVVLKKNDIAYRPVFAVDEGQAIGTRFTLLSINVEFRRAFDAAVPETLVEGCRGAIV